MQLQNVKFTSIQINMLQVSYKKIQYNWLSISLSCLETFNGKIMQLKRHFTESVCRAMLICRSQSIDDLDTNDDLYFS